MRVSKGLCLNASRLTPRLMGTKTPHLTPSPLKTLVLAHKFDRGCGYLYERDHEHPMI